jgi:hypothetical protein
MLAAMNSRALGWLAVTGAIALFAAAASGQEEGDAPAPQPSTSASSSAEPVDACLGAFSDAQRLRREGSLRAARQALIQCSQPTCPELIVSRCTPWLRDVGDAIPSIVPLAKDRLGRDMVNVRVVVDGAPFSEVLDGRPIELDPGAHQILFEAAGQPPVAVDVVLAQGQKSRVVEVVIGAVTPPPPPLPEVPPPRPLPPDAGFVVSPWAWVGFGVGAAAFIAAGITGGLALARADELEETCGGLQCSDEVEAEFDDGARLAHASTGLFVVGGLATAFGVVALLWLGPDDQGGAVIGPRGVGFRF